MTTTCVISQPTFMPWLGWFDLVDQSDVVVLLDDVAFSKQSWQQRNRIRTRNELEFLTVPVKTSGRLGQRLLECELGDQRFVDKTLNGLRANYGKAPFFKECFDSLAAAFAAGAASGRLVGLNCSMISWMAGRLGITKQMILASTLGVGYERGEHVAGICECVGSTRYLSPAGAEAYLLEDRLAFDRRGISVWLHVYEHPAYPQRFDPFIPFATALDLILNVGPEAPEVMRSGRRPSRALGEPLPNHL